MLFSLTLNCSVKISQRIKALGIITSFVILSSGCNFSIWMSSFKSALGIAVCREQDHSDFGDPVSKQSAWEEAKDTPTHRQKNPKNPEHRLHFAFIFFFSRKLFSNATSESSWQNSHHWIYNIEKSTSRVQKLLSNTSESVVCRSIDSLLIFRTGHIVCPLWKFQNVCSWNFASTIYHSRNLLYSLHSIVICYQLPYTGLALKWMRKK